MKLLLILVTVLTLSSCANHQLDRGQYFFNENSPSFYLSLAPSFGTPYEYEVISSKLVLREFDGRGGYEWGKSKELVIKVLSKEQEEKIRSFAVAAIKDAILEEEKGIDVIVMDGTTWFIQSDYGFGPSLSASTNNPPQSFFELRDFVESILKGRRNET